MLLHDILHFFGRAICHQFEERSLQVSGEALAVCARDTGIYIGIFSTLIYLHFSKRGKSITIPSIKISILLLLFLLPLMVDGLGSYTHLFESNNIRRLMTGIAFGFVLPYFIYPLLSKESLDNKSEPVLKVRNDLYLPLLISCIIGGLVYFGKVPLLLLNSVMILTIILWFSLLASFLFSNNKQAFKWTRSILFSISSLSILSIIHSWISSLTI